MESKHKNALIGALLAVVFVMAVGYAAFAQQLTINGTAEITSKWNVHFSSDAADTTITAKNGLTGADVTDPKSTTDTVNPTGSLSYDEDYLVATIGAKLVQPGDTVTYTLMPTNYSVGLKAKAADTNGIVVAEGTYDAGETRNAGTMTITPAGGATGTTIAEKGNIRFTITFNPSTSLAASTDGTAKGGQDTITVKAEYINTTASAASCSDTNYTDKDSCEANSGTWTPASEANTDAATKIAKIKIDLNYVQATA